MASLLRVLSGGALSHLRRHGVRELLHARPQIHPLEGGRSVGKSGDLLHQHEVHEHALFHLWMPYLLDMGEVLQGHAALRYTS